MTHRAEHLLYLGFSAGLKGTGPEPRCVKVPETGRRRGRAFKVADREAERGFFILILLSAFCKQEMRRKMEGDPEEGRAWCLSEEEEMEVGGAGGAGVSIVIAGSEESLPFRIEKRPQLNDFVEQAS